MDNSELENNCLALQSLTETLLNFSQSKVSIIEERLEKLESIADRICEANGVDLSDKKKIPNYQQIQFLQLCTMARKGNKEEIVKIGNEAIDIIKKKGRVEE